MHVTTQGVQLHLKQITEYNLVTKHPRDYTWRITASGTGKRILVTLLGFHSREKAEIKMETF